MGFINQLITGEHHPVWTASDQSMKDADGCLGASARRLKYMDMVVRETLRLCSPVQALGDLGGKIHQNPMLEI